MALSTKIQDSEFSVGDRVRVIQKLDKRESAFEGIVIKIKGRGMGKTFTVRRVGEAGIGIEKIFPVNLPSIEKVTVVKKGLEGVRRAKLYYIRKQSPTEIEMIFKKAALKRAPKVQGKTKAKKPLPKISKNKK